ncbi:winged helix-turn-helix transcriptional regulator [Rhizobium leguminosarum]|nr:winged helix-turn-helix transcriptional regulator [Rhizobium leguminosarum]
MQETERGYASRGYRMICAEIRNQIESGLLVPGARIPSETEMMLQFGVSKMTAARARQELSMLRMIYAVPGIGSFVAGKAKPLSRLLGAKAKTN